VNLVCIAMKKITFASHFVVCDVSDLSFSFSVRAMRALL
jgi:hypothetical protein